MKKILIILIIGITNSLFSQSSKEIDSVSNIMCEYLKEIEIRKIANRKAVLYKKTSLYEKHLFPYLENFKKSKAKNIEQKINYRLQRNCSEFRYLSNKIENPEKNFSEINEKSNSTISEKELKEFKNQNKFYYFESAKATMKVKVVMQNGKWEISFSDKTFCKMKYKWVSEKKYELVFIESNNKFMSEYSVKGDKYIHQVLSKENGFYYININTEGQNTFTKFKMYYE